MPASVVRTLHDETEALTNEILQRLAEAAALGDRETFDLLSATLEHLLDAMRVAYGVH